MAGSAGERAVRAGLRRFGVDAATHLLIYRRAGVLLHLIRRTRLGAIPVPLYRRRGHATARSSAIRGEVGHHRVVSPGVDAYAARGKHPPHASRRI